MNKLIDVRHDRFDKAWQVLITENGWQWMTVFVGSRSEVKIIADAYKKVGYKKGKY